MYIQSKKSHLDNNITEVHIQYHINCIKTHESLAKYLHCKVTGSLNSHNSIAIYFVYI